MSERWDDEMYEAIAQHARDNALPELKFNVIGVLTAAKRPIVDDPASKAITYKQHAPTTSTK